MRKLVCISQHTAACVGTAYWSRLWHWQVLQAEIGKATLRRGASFPVTWFRNPADDSSVGLQLCAL